MSKSPKNRRPERDDDTPAYDLSPLERRVMKMSENEAKAALLAAMGEYSNVVAGVVEAAEGVLGEDRVAEIVDEHGNPDAVEIAQALADEVRELGGAVM